MSTHRTPFLLPWLTVPSCRRCNSTYPASRPLLGRGAGSARYRVAVITDLDQASRRDSGWVSLLRHGWLEWRPRDGRPPTAAVTWDPSDVVVKSSLANVSAARGDGEVVRVGLRWL